MSARRSTPPTAPSAARGPLRVALTDGLALLMLLAGSIVWPR
jgi:hypothetical protein